MIAAWKGVTMGAQLGKRLAENAGFAELVRGNDQVVAPLLPATTRAFWDLSENGHNGPLLTLALSDPFGYAVTHFAPDELTNSQAVRGRVHELVGELLQSARRERIEIQDAFASAQQIQQLQERMNAIPEIAKKRPKLFNRMQLSPENSQNFLITDFAVEVDGGSADEVKHAIRDSGFLLREEPILDRPGMRDRVRELVKTHLQDVQNVPRHAICFNLQDPADVHLLEVADDVSSLGEGTLEGIGFIAGHSLLGVRSLVLYLTSSTDLRLVAEYNPNHPAVRDFRNGQCWFVHPDDGGDLVSS